MRQRIRIKPSRVRLKLKPRTIKATYDTRPKEYLNLRYWWLHELRQLRAKRHITGANVKKDMKAAQRELSKLRQEHC